MPSSDMRRATLADGPDRRTQTNAHTIVVGNLADKPTHFNYSTLSPDAVSDLQSTAARLRSQITKSTADMIAIGRVLVAIKDRIERGQFTTWVEAEVGVSIRTAQGYMRFADIAATKGEMVSLLPPPTVRLLASKSTPPEIVDQVLASAQGGRIVPESAVREMIEDDRHEKREAKAEAARTARRKRLKINQRDYDAERRREREEAAAAAETVLSRFSKDDLGFLLDMLGKHDFLDVELRRRLSGEVTR